jgi:hypothetical protein
MPRRPNRPRRAVTRRQLIALRAAGWRYSSTREAWVHRIGRGRIGPVFRLAADLGEPEHNTPDLTLFEALVAARQPRLVPAEQRTPLPRRIEARPPTRVEVSLRPTEPPRPVVVDGRPPVRGTDPRVLRTDGMVVPMRRRAVPA